MKSDQIEKQEKVAGICSTCEVAMKTHPSCYTCGILIGKGHLEPTGYRLKENTLCGDCLAQLKKWHYLYLGGSLYMLPNGDIKRRKTVLEEDDGTRSGSTLTKEETFVV